MDFGYALPLVLLALVPLGLVLVTSFLKFSIVLAFLRQALGSPDVPPSIVLLAVAVLLSGFVMAPTAAQMGRAAQTVMERGEDEIPLADLPLAELMEVGAPVVAPLHAFLDKHAGSAERAVFVELARSIYPEQEQALASKQSALVLVSAFVLTELKEAFLIGFVVFIPFLVVELACANILLSLNMHMLNPTSVSLPFKLLLFVLVDGWTLLVQGLILGYGA